MEKDITILKSLIEDLKREEKLIGYDAEVEIQAIESLIKGYRELEEKLDNSRKANELLNKTNNELRLEIRTTYSKVVNDIISKFNLGDDFIPKSKVKEIIDECIPKGKNIITGKEEYQPNTNANSFLTQRILELMEDK